MKYTLILLLPFILHGISSCRHTDNRPSKRYFLVSYLGQNDSTKTWGCFFSNGDLLTQQQYQHIISQHNQCEKHLRLADGDYTITSLYEFEDSTEYKHFKNSPDIPLLSCPAKTSNE